MFAKPASFKPSAAIKNSERKKVLAQIENQCGLSELEPEQKQLLLPKTVQAASALTHGNDKVTVYSENQLPLWINYRSAFVPTVALVSRLPSDLQSKILPVVYTVARTLRYLQNGADFMTPGIFGDLPTGPIKIGAPVQIRDIEGGGVLATGIALRDLSQITPNDAGKCVQTVSVVGDKLTPAETIVGPSEPPSEEGKKGKESSEVEEEKQCQAVPEKRVEEPKQPPVESLEIDDADSEDLTPKEVDEAFMYAVNKVIRQPQHKYPMTMANFASLLGANYPYEHSQLNIKNSTFKKMGKLLKNAEKLGLINTRDRQGGEVIVMSVNVPQNEMEPEPPVRKSQKNKANLASLMKAYISYKPTASMRQIMAPEEAKVELHEVGNLRKQALNYISQQKLLTPDNEVRVDEPLRKALGLRQNVETVKREEIGALIIKQSSPLHKIVAPGQDPDDVAWTKGNIPKVHVKTERRGGNKVVTLIRTDGLTGFKINPQELAEELRHACAGSSTISDVKGVKVIVVQGNHVAKVVKVLEKRGVKQSWIQAN